MFRSVVALGLSGGLLLGVGCVPPPSNRPAVTSFDREIESRAIHTSCEGGGVADRCGLIVKYATKDSFRTRFREKRCVTHSDEECQKAYDEFVEGQLLSRYTEADWSAVRRTCARRAPLCEDPVEFELLLVDSHNLNVRTEVGKAVIEHDERQARERAANAENVDAARAVEAGLRVMHLWVGVLSAADKTFNKKKQH